MAHKSVYLKEQEIRMDAYRAKAALEAAEVERRIKLEEIPAGHVRITTTTPRYRRSVNGAWMGAGGEISTRFVHEAALVNGFHPSHSYYKIEWKDGHMETASSDNAGYATCSGPRLRYLSQWALVLLPYQRKGVMRAVGHSVLMDRWTEAQIRIDSLTSTGYAQAWSWPRVTRIDQAILEHFGETHGNL